MRTSISTLLAIFSIISLSIQSAAAAPVTYTNLIAGNATATTDIPSAWWGTDVSTIVNGGYLDRWISGNSPAGPNTQIPFTVTVTLTTPQTLSKVRSVITEVPGGLQNVDVVAKNSSNVVVGSATNVTATSAFDWHYDFGSRLDDVKTLTFTANAFHATTPYDMRITEIIAYDDGAQPNLALTASTSFSSNFIATAGTNDADISTRAYSANTNGDGTVTADTYVIYNLGATKDVAGFRVWGELGVIDQLRDFQVQGWTGSSWTNLLTVTDSNSLYREFALGSAYSTDQIRLFVTRVNSGGDMRVRIGEFEIIQAVPVPEPNTIAMLLGTLVLVPVARRRRN